MFHKKSTLYITYTLSIITTSLLVVLSAVHAFVWLIILVIYETLLGVIGEIILLAVHRQMDIPIVICMSLKAIRNYIVIQLLILAYQEKYPERRNRHAAISFQYFYPGEISVRNSLTESERVDIFYNKVLILFDVLIVLSILSELVSLILYNNDTLFFSLGMWLLGVVFYFGHFYKCIYLEYYKPPIIDLDKIAVDHECSICMKPFTEAYPLTCGHQIHSECLDKWYQSGHNTCPFCRTSF